MSSARVSPILIATAMLLCSLAARADAPAVKNVEARPAAYAVAGTTTRTAVLADLRSAFADGEHIGALRTGGACDASTDREWSELVRQRVDAELPKAFNDEMTHARGLFPAATGAAPLRVQAFLNNIDVQLCQAAGAWQGGFYVQVSWQIVSPDSGQVVYQASTEGSFSLNEPQRIATVTGLREAFGVAARNLLADPRFGAMLHSADQRRVALAY
jgi:hypothetical protein